MTATTAETPDMTCFTTNASLRPGRHIILQQGARLLFPAAESCAAAGNAPRTPACIGSTGEEISTFLHVGA